MKFGRHDTVRFLVDFPESGIKAGEEGVVTEAREAPESYVVDYERDEFNTLRVEVLPGQIEPAEPPMESG